MNTIYAPKGKAAEYGELALNLYRGCSHGCTYCYAPSVLHMSREEFSKPQARQDILPAIEDVAGRYEGQNVFLCFTTDPYQPIDEQYMLTRKAIKILHAANVTVRILTKGGFRATRDFDLLGPGDAFGVTLTVLSCEDLIEFEPGAASFAERFATLQQAHEAGIYTWVSLEPVLDPLQTLEIIKMTSGYVDEYKVGKWNYDKRANEIDWARFLVDVEGLLQNLGKKYYIKDDLRKYRRVCA